MDKYGIFILTIVMYSTGVAGEPGLPDPTRPPDYVSGRMIVQRPQQKQDVTFNLTAIRIDKDDRSAIINDQLLREGESVDSATLLEIYPARVVLEYDNKRFVVRLYEELAKKISDAEKAKKTN